MLVVAGSRGMSGAAVLCARGALRSGAGLVTVATARSQQPLVAVQVAEALTWPLPETVLGTLARSALASISRLIRDRRINALAIGPGLSTQAETVRLVRALVSEVQVPIVLDADGLNAVAGWSGWPRVHGPIVMTPHPGELARLLPKDRGAVQSDRAGSATALAKRFGAVCVLKGHHTVVTHGQKVRVNPTGNPAMASGGMGDVLTGVIAALLAQGVPPFEAACLGAYVHGWAGDLAKEGPFGLVASDVAERLPRAFKKVLGV